jgi:hypothetical membrane protein
MLAYGYMKRSRYIKTFTDRYPFVGPLFWLLGIQYFITQIIVSRAWPFHYSYWLNTISDLGNTRCGVYLRMPVCSPLHAFMNYSFITLGASMVIGAVLIYHEVHESRGTRLGFTLMGLAGIGTLIVGLVPENTINPIHVLGATMAFLLGNVSMTVLGWSLHLPIRMRLYTIISGILSLFGLVLLGIALPFHLAVGFVERIAGYPQTAWLIVFGFYMTKNRYALRRDPNSAHVI